MNRRCSIHMKFFLRKPLFVALLGWFISVLSWIILNNFIPTRMPEENVWMCIGRLRFFWNDMDENSELVSRCNRNILENVQKVLATERNVWKKKSTNISFVLVFLQSCRIVKIFFINFKNVLHKGRKIVNCFFSDLLDYVSNIVQ